MTVRSCLSEINLYLANAHRELGMLAETCKSMVAETNRLQAERDEALGRAARLSLELDAARREPRSQTTSEQIEERTEPAPPEGWRVLAVGEKLQAGDMTVRSDGYCYSTERVGYYVGANQRYIRRIESRPDPQSGLQHSEYKPPEGWRLLSVGEWVTLNDRWVRQDGSTWRSMGTEGRVSEGFRYIRRIQQPKEESQPEPTTSDQTVKVEEQVEPEPRKVEGPVMPEPEKVEEQVRSEQAATISRWQQQVEAVKAELVQERLLRNHWQNHAQRAENELVNKDYECQQMRIELDALQQAPQPEPTTSDQTAKVEGQVGSEPEKVQVREGRWLTRGGEVRNVTRTPDDEELQDEFPWRDANTGNMWREDGRYVRERENVRDLVNYLGPIEPRPESQSGLWGVLRRLWFGIYAGGSDV